MMSRGGPSGWHLVIVRELLGLKSCAASSLLELRLALYRGEAAALGVVAILVEAHARFLGSASPVPVSTTSRVAEIGSGRVCNTGQVQQLCLCVPPLRVELWKEASSIGSSVHSSYHIGLN